MNVFRETTYSIGGNIWEYVNHHVWTVPGTIDVTNDTGPYKLKGYLNGSITNNALPAGAYARFTNTAGNDGADIFNQYISGNNPFSIELWAQPLSSPTNAAFVSKGDGQVSIRYISNPSGSNVQAGRIPGDMMKLVTNVTSSQSTNGAGEAPSNAANNNPNNKWCNTLSTWPSTGVFLQYELSSPQIARVFMLTSANDDMAYPSRSLQNVRVQGSNDGSGWTTLTTQTGISYTANYQDRVFNFDNETAYTYYRLLIDRTVGGTSGTFQLACFSLGTGEGAQLEPGDLNPRLVLTIGGKSGSVDATAEVGMEFLGGVHRIVGVFTGSGIELWLDGELLKSVPVPEGFEIGESSNDLCIGYAPDRNFTSNSIISGARVFSRALSNAELRDNARSPYDPPSGSGVVLWTDFSKPVEKTPPIINDVYGNGMYLGYGGDWGEGNHDNYFCADGLLDPSVPNRQEEPEVREVKKSYQPLVITASNANLNNGIVNVRNEYYATNANEFDWVWTLYEDDKVLGKGTLNNVPSMPPMTNQLILVNIPTVALNVPYLSSLPASATPGAEYFLMIQACLKEDADWAPKGYPLNEEQFKLPFSTATLPVMYREDYGAVNVDQTGNIYDINGDGFTVRFNGATGEMTSYIADGVELISAGPAPTFFRAKLANDRSGTNLNNWVNTDLTKTLSLFTVNGAADRKSVTINATYTLTISANSFIDMTYVVYGNGTVRVTTALRTSYSSQMLRFGVDLIMPAGFENVDWYTRGPEENLNDRATGYYIGRYQTTATDNFWPYAKPQDTGTHQDTRFMALTSDTQDKGMMIVATGSRLFEANALHYTWRDLNSGTEWWSTGVKHPYELKPRKETVVGINYGSRGTGNESCMTVPPLTQFQLPSGNMAYSYTFVPFDKADQAGLTAVSRLYRNPGSLLNFRTYGLTAERKGDFIEATLYNNTDETKEANLIAAVYDGDTRLAVVEVKNVTFGAGIQTVTFETDISGLGGYDFKVFAWEQDSMIPICAEAINKL